MEINNKTIKLFNNDHSALFRDLMLIKEVDLLLNGSFPITFFASDIDLYSKLQMKDYKTLLNELLSFLLDVEVGTEISELKIGKEKAKSKKKIIELVASEIKNPKYIFEGKNWVKLDLIVLINGYYEEVTIIYDFGDSIVGKTRDEVTNELVKDVFELDKEGKYYKAVKRLREIYKRTGVMDKMELMDSILNSDMVGFLYLTNARLEALKKSKDERPRKNYVLSNLKEDIMIRLENVFNLNLKKTDFKMKNIDKIQREIMKKLHSLVKKTVKIEIDSFKRLMK